MPQICTVCHDNNAVRVPWPHTYLSDGRLLEDCLCASCWLSNRDEFSGAISLVCRCRDCVEAVEALIPPPMTPEAMLKFIEENWVRVTAVIERVGNGKARLLEWHAGYTRLHANGWTNVVLESSRAVGATMQEAVNNLVLIKKLPVKAPNRM